MSNETQTVALGPGEDTPPSRKWATINFRSERPWTSRWGPVTVLITGLVASAGLLVGFARQLWFFGDDWEFLLLRGTVPGSNVGLFAPHNEHWSTIPILIFRAIFAVVGLRQYLPYALPVIAAHLGVVTLMYLLLVRFGTSRWVAVAVALFLAFLGAGAENTLWDFQVGFVGSVFFGLLAFWLYDQHEKRGWRTSAVWLALVLALMCSGNGLVMLGAVCLYVAARRGLVRAAVVLSVPVAVYATWYVVWGRSGRAGASPVPHQWDYLLVPQFVWTGLTNAGERSIGIPGTGGLILVGLVGAALVAQSTPATLRHFAWAGLAGALAEFVLTGIARISLGVQQATASRYVYIAAVLMAPALALVLQLVADRLTMPRWLPTCLVVGMGALVVLSGVRLTHQFQETRLTLVESTRPQILGAASLVRQGGLVLTAKPEPVYDPNITTDLLGSPQIQAALPSPSLSAKRLLDAAAQIEVGVSRARLPLPSARTPALVSGFIGTSAARNRCHPYEATVPRPVIELPPTTAGSQVRITAFSTVISTVLRRGSLASTPVSWPVHPGLPVFVGTSAPNGALEITLDHGGKVTICT